MCANLVIKECTNFYKIHLSSQSFVHYILNLGHISLFCLCVMRELTRHDALIHKLLPSSPLLQTELEDCERAETQRSGLNF